MLVVSSSNVWLGYSVIPCHGEGWVLFVFFSMHFKKATNDLLLEIYIKVPQLASGFLDVFVGVSERGLSGRNSFPQ